MLQGFKPKLHTVLLGNSKGERVVLGLAGQLCGILFEQVRGVEACMRSVTA